jgi:hypothetical protein
MGTSVYVVGVRNAGVPVIQWTVCKFHQVKRVCSNYIFFFLPFFFFLLFFLDSSCHFSQINFLGYIYFFYKYFQSCKYWVVMRVGVWLGLSSCRRMWGMDWGAWMVIWAQVCM